MTRGQGKGTSVSIWTTGRCNLSCPHCFQRGRPDLQVDLKGETLEQAIAWLRLRNDNVQFYGGEPLLNIDAVKRILAAFPGRRFSVTTNGTLLDREAHEWLKYHGCSVALSLDGTPETMKKQRPGAYEAIMENLSRLLDLTTQVIMVLVDPTCLVEDLEHVRGLGFTNVAINLLKAYSGAYEDLEALEREYRRAIFELHDPPRFRISEVSRFTGFMGQPPTCGIANRGLAVAPDGYLYPCIDAPLLGHSWAIGHVSTGIDPAREIHVREQSRRRPERCSECPGAGLRPRGLCHPCPVNSVTYHGCWAAPVDLRACEAMIIQHRVIAEYARLHPEKVEARTPGVSARPLPPQKL